MLNKDWRAQPEMLRFVCEACPVGVASGQPACVQENVDFDLVCKLRVQCSLIMLEILVLARSEVPIRFLHTLNSAAQTVA